MRKISKKDSERILNYIKKARSILYSVSDGEEIRLSSAEIAGDILSEISGIEFAVNNTIYGD